MDPSLDRYCRDWNLRVLGKLVEDRPTSQVFKVEWEGRLAVLKLLTALGIEDERHGALALGCWDGSGAARLYMADEGAHLLEYIEGADCVSLVLAGRDDEASKIIGQSLAQMHTSYRASPPKALTTLGTRFSELFDTTRRPGVDPIFHRAAETAHDLLSAPLNTAVLHGDMHHENILRSDTRGWLAIDAKGLRGETTYDGAMPVLNPQRAGALIETPERIQRTSAILAEKMDVSETRLLRFTFAHACLCACWSMETPAFSSARALRIARIIEQILAGRA